MRASTKALQFPNEPIKPSKSHLSSFQHLKSKIRFNFLISAILELINWSPYLTEGISVAMRCIITPQISPKFEGGM